MERVTQQNAALVEEAVAAVELLEQQARGLGETVGVFRLEASQSDAPDEVNYSPRTGAQDERHCCADVIARSCMIECAQFSH
jgi:hypothetical protein